MTAPGRGGAGGGDGGALPLSAGRPLQVARFLGTRRGDADRGPEVRMNADEARQRLMQDGELVWVYGPRRQELAPLVIDDSVRRGEVFLRDIAGAAVSEIVRVLRVNTDRPPRNRGHVG